MAAKETAVCAKCRHCIEPTPRALCRATAVRDPITGLEVYQYTCQERNGDGRCEDFEYYDRTPGCVIVLAMLILFVAAVAYTAALLTGGLF